DARHLGGRLLYELSYQLSSQTLSRKDPMYTRGNLGILIPEVFPENAASLIPNVYVAGLIPLDGSQPRPREYLNHTFSAALTLQHVNLMVKTGGVFALENVNSNLFPETTQGTFVFDSGGGFTPFQNFLRGNSGGACGEPCWYSETDIDPLNRFRSARYEAFLQ